MIAPSVLNNPIPRTRRGAARSGKQNIAEGSQASGTSKKMELKLVGVARASLEELLRDYNDYLRIKKLPLWGKNHRIAKKIRALCYTPNRSFMTYRVCIEDCSDEIAANTLICLIHQSNYLLDKLLRALEKDFLENGGFSENLYRIRSEIRNRDKRK
jgi:restriction system protein